IKEDPAPSSPWNQIGWWLAIAPGNRGDGELAVEFATMAVNLFKNGDTEDTLACALARTGDFKNADIVEQQTIRADYFPYGKEHKKYFGYDKLPPENRVNIENKHSCEDKRFGHNYAPFEPKKAYFVPKKDNEHGLY